MSTNEVDMIKLAVQYVPISGHVSQKSALLTEFNRTGSLAKFISDVCNYFGLEQAENYGILTEIKYDKTHVQYVTESNKRLIKKGSLLQLVPCVTHCAADIIKTIASGIKEEKKLLNHCSDPAFAAEFIKQKGLLCLRKAIEEDRIENRLGSVLQAFAELMDHFIVTWAEITTPSFVDKMVSFVNSQTQNDPIVLVRALETLESIALSSNDNYALVEKMIPLPNLMRHVDYWKSGRATGSSAECDFEEQVVAIQASVLALINALFQKAQPNRREYYFRALSQRNNRRIIVNNIIIPGKLGPDIQHNLHVLQQLLLNVYKDSMNTPLDPTDLKAQESMKELRSIAFEENREVHSSKDITVRKMEVKKEFRYFGFKDEINPANDFTETPPGVLALENMCYFSRNNPEQYSKLVLENCYRADSHACPFGQASIEVTKLLCEILRIGEEPQDKGTFHPMLFAHDHSFEDLFCICIVLFNKTWKEMKATKDDFSKVVSVVRDQITRTLETQPTNRDQFSEKINSFSYDLIARLWQKERCEHEEQEMQAPAIRELREQIKPEIIELIQQNRYNFLMRGTLFKIPKTKERKNFRYCCLSPNYKFLLYDDFEKEVNGTLPSENLNQKISIADIKDVSLNAIGKDPANLKDRKDKKKPYLTFSIHLDNTTDSKDRNPLHFIALNETDYHCWWDGINALLRKRMQSPAAEEDLEKLLVIELKLRLLDTEGVPIPQHPPPIPPPPPNYNFFFQIN